MKVTLDLDRLLADGQITPEEHRRILSLAKEDTGSLGLNILIAFGVLATAGGVLARLHSILAAVGIGLAIGFVGVLLIRWRPRVWGVLGSVLTLVGSLTAGGGIVSFSQGDVVGFIYTTLIFASGAFFAGSGLLAALTALALAGVVGAATSYLHACYMLTVQKPTLTVVIFGVLSWAAYLWSLKLGPDRGRLALMFSRTSLFLVNMGFWVGSLWGDAIWHERSGWDLHSGQDVPDWIFSVTWALAIVATGVWGVRGNRRWVVNLMAVFGAIHFYTQYFERLGASPGTLLTGGVVALGLALLIARYNQGARAASRESLC